MLLCTNHQPSPQGGTVILTSPLGMTVSPQPAPCNPRHRCYPCQEPESNPPDQPPSVEFAMIELCF